MGHPCACCTAELHTTEHVLHITNCSIRYKCFLTGAVFAVSYVEDGLQFWMNELRERIQRLSTMPPEPSVNIFAICFYQLGKASTSMAFVLEICHRIPDISKQFSQSLLVDDRTRSRKQVRGSNEAPRRRTNTENFRGSFR